MVQLAQNNTGAQNSGGVPKPMLNGGLKASWTGDKTTTSKYFEGQAEIEILE